VRNIRRAVQALAFVLFIVLVFQAARIAEFPDDADTFTRLVERPVPADLFPRLSVLGAAATFAASDEIRDGITSSNFAPLVGHVLQYLPAIIMLAATVLLGRFFCSWVCPLGTTLDITDKLCAGARKLTQVKLYDGRRLKIYLLIVILLAALLGVQMSGWLDPLSIAPRSYILAGHPYLTRLTDGLFGMLRGIPAVHYVTDPVHDALRAALHVNQQPSYVAHWLFALMLLAIVLFGRVLSRYWCRNLCPLGAMLSLSSGWSIFKRRVSDECIECGKCVRACPMGAISADGRITKAGECILCMTCQAVCPTGAITFGTEQPAGQHVPVDITRRGLIASVAAGIASVPLMGINVTRRLGSGGEPASVIRPPGARDEAEFLDRCVRCGECMRVCKTNGLQPVWFESGLEGMWTPQLVPRLGYCDRNCTLCGQVCPSQAIKALTLDEKKHLALGKARFNRNACIPWVGWARFRDGLDEWEDANCAVCEEVCPIPTKAIRFNTFKGKVNGEEIEIRRPYVEEDLCTGCGFCEKVCPIEGSAVKVIPMQGGKARVEDAPQAATSIGELFPKVIGEWRLSKKPFIYPAADLYEYINGAAPPYQSYNLKFVAVAAYVHEGNKKEIRADIWEFADSDDACGVFFKDTIEVPRVKGIGTLAAAIETTCWVWKGEYWLWLQPGRRSASAEETQAIAGAIADALPAKDAEPPKLLSVLPEESRVPLTFMYLHKTINFNEVYYIGEENVFGLDEKTNVAAARYQSDKETYNFAVIEYPTPADAAAGASGFEAHLGKSCKPQPPAGPISVWKQADGAHFIFAHSRRYLLAAFSAVDLTVARKTLEAAMKKLGERGW